MKIFFTLGRNPKLSRAEIIEFLKSQNQLFKQILFEKNILILETNLEPNIQELGGTLQLGKIIFEGTEENLKKYLDQNELIPADKFSYAVLGNTNIEILKQTFKKRKKKAVEKHGKKQIKFQNRKKQKFPKADFYILLYHLPPTTYHLGLVNQSYNNTDDKIKDMQKPIRREELAISPRLAKILINLSGAKLNDTLLDPFCGIGAILQEALIKKINTYGTDKDKQATENAKKNLEWLTEKFKIQNKFIIKNTDANLLATSQLQNFTTEKFDAIATEPPLGELLRKKPSKQEAKKIISDFESKIIPILKQLRQIKKPTANLAITFPTLQNLHVDAKKIAQQTGLKIHLEPITESRQDQFISRDILVFQ